MPQKPEPDTSDKTTIDSDQWQGKCVCVCVWWGGGEWGMGRGPMLLEVNPEPACGGQGVLPVALGWNQLG